MPTDLSPRPWHLLPVALLLVLWHGALAGENMAERLGWSLGLPPVTAALPLDVLWVSVAWSMTLWLGLAAALFLLFSDDAAVLLFFAAAVAMLAALFGIARTGAPEQILTLPWRGVAMALGVVPLIGWLYARALNQQGMLH